MKIIQLERFFFPGLMILFFVSCSSVPAKELEIVHGSSMTLTTNLTPKSTQTVVPSPTVEITSTPDWSAIPSLQDAVLTPDDLPLNNTAPFNQILSGVVKAEDITSDVGDRCQLDCVQKFWTTQENKITLLMIRTGTVDDAENAVVQYYNEFGPPDYEYTEMLSYKLYSTKYSKIKTGWAMLTKDCRFVAASRYGTVEILIISTHVPGNDDLPYEMQVALDLLADQVNKLESLGYLP